MTSSTLTELGSEARALVTTTKHRARYDEAPEALELYEEALAGTEKDDNSRDADKADARFWAARARVELGIRRGRRDADRRGVLQSARSER
jgi:hypothetical protein